MLHNVQARDSYECIIDIGANVLRAPLAAQRALADGHTLCSHTWSHPAMTSLSNEQVVAELYWTLRVIKEVAGVTVKCCKYYIRHVKMQLQVG